MKATSRTTKTKRKRRTGRATAAPRTSFGKLSLREISETSDGYKWTSYLVQGFRDEAGRHGRKKFKTRDDALAWIATKGVELVNTDTALHNVVTRLSKTQVEEAESAFTRLAGRHALGEAVDFFMRNYAQPDTPTPLDRALEAFLENREREGVRPRSLVQLRSTGSQFIGFVTLAKVPTALVPEIDRVRAELEANRAASLVEVIRALPADLRPSARAASEDLDTVLDLLRKRDLSPALREAVATVRDILEARRRPSEKDLAAALVATVPGVRVPAVHEITTGDVESFMGTRRAKDGTGAAARKTLNNCRADLHAWLGWCAEPQRRWCASNPATAVAKYKLGRGVPHVLPVAQVRELMDYVATYEGGAMAPFFALALFAGLRSGPDGELLKLARHPERAKLIDLARGVIHVQPEISKTHQYRQTTIRPALHAWLTRYGGDIWPTNADRMAKHIRNRFALPHDVLRHSFFSYLVGSEGSVERAALEGGNTESILRRHYLNLTNTDEAADFWQILPPGKKSKVVKVKFA